MNSSKTRNSSIEILKIIAIFFIVITHTMQTLGTAPNTVPFNDYVLNYSVASTDINHLIMVLLNYSGQLGVSIFFICSAWFLIDEDKINYRKVLNMIIDVWVISVIIYLLVSLIGGVDLDWLMVIKQFLPNTFSNNWYITAYILFYLFHGHLNTIIKSLDQRRLLRLSLIMSILYIAMNFVLHGLFASSQLIFWATIYFCIAYIKKYMIETANNIKLNVWLVVISLVCGIGLIFLTNILGLRFSFFSDQLLHWNINCNPFILLTAVGLLNIARNCNLNNKAINYLSKLTMTVYVIHENILLREFYRPALWQYVYERFGYSNILLWCLVLSSIIFVFALVSSIIYHHTIRNLSMAFSSKLYSSFEKFWTKAEDTVIKKVK